MSIHRVIHVAKMTNVSGMERHLLTLLPGLKATGLDVSLLVLVEPDKPMDGYIADLNRQGVAAEAVPISRDFDPGLINRLALKFRDTGADAVHTHLIHADLHGMLAAQTAGIRQRFFTAHNDDRFRRLLPVRLVQGALWRQVQAGIAISESLRRFVIKVEFAPPPRVQTVHYGLDSTTLVFDPSIRDRLRAELNIPANVPVAGSICRLTEQKGLPYALDALRQLPNAHYVIVGDGPLRGDLEAQVSGAGLQDRVHFLGWRNNASALMPAFDVLLMPSLWEGFGLVALEAMAAQVPILASNVSALPEIVVDGETGYLVPPADSAAIADRLRDLFGDPAKARRLGIQGRQRLEQVFSVERMVQGTLKVYGV